MNKNIFSEKMLDIVPSGSELEKLETGFVFLEGPVWDRMHKVLFFTDFNVLKIYIWDPVEGVKLFRENSGRAIGLSLDTMGRLLACESKTRRISRTEDDGSIVNLAANYKGRRIHSPNDIVVKSDGSVYFTDPYSTLLMDTRELDFDGVFRIDAGTGELKVLADDFVRPNGLAFSPDEKLLYIDDTKLQLIRVFDVEPDGGLSNGRVFAELDPGFGPGVPDGMKVDTEGNVYVTGPGGIWIISPSGEKLGIIKMPEQAANLCFGDDDGKTLYITASTSLYRIRTNIPGIMAGIDNLGK